MSGNSGQYLFPYNSKNTLNRLIFDSSKRRREGLENASPSSAQLSGPTLKNPVASSLLGRKTPSNTRELESSFCRDVDEVQQILTSSPKANNAYMRQNESILVSPGGRDTLQAGRYVTDQQLPTYQPSESVEMIFDDCVAQLGNQLKGKYAETSQKLSDLQQKYEAISERLLTAETQLKESRQVATSALVEAKVKEAEKKASDNLCAETKSQLATLVQENDRLKAELIHLKAEAERLRTSLDSYRLRLGKLSESLAAVKSGLRELGQAHSSSQEQLQLVRMEFEDIKRKATSGLEALRPILDEEGTLARSREMKALINDLQESLVSSHQVTDILRNKIMHQASQLADAQARVKELQEQSSTKLFITTEDNKKHIALLVDMGKNLEAVTAKLIVREKETLDALVACAAHEANLEALSTEIETYKTSSAAHATEREENISKLLALQDTINSRDKEIATLKADLRALKESKEEVRVLLAEAKKDLAQRELEIRARDPNIEFQLKIEDLTEETSSLRTRLQQAEEEKKTALDNWLAQENELKKRVYESEGAKIAIRVSNDQLQANLSTIRTELASLVVEHQGRCEELRTATDDVSKLQERLDAQAVELSQSKEAYNELNVQFRKLEARMEEKERVFHVQEMRASVVEDSLGWAKGQLAAANLKNEELSARIAASSLEVSAVKETAEQAISSVRNDSRAQLTVLQQRILQMESVNVQATGRAENLIELYRTGKLTDAEKLFVSHIISETEAVQEERIVKKDHELRLRQMALEKANSKLIKAQEAVGRLLAEKNVHVHGGDQSMVDLRVTSSEANKGVAAALAPGLIGNVSEDDTPLTQIHYEAEVESDVKHGIKRSRSPSLQGETQKRRKQREVVPKKNKGKKKK